MERVKQSAIILLSELSFFIWFSMSEERPYINFEAVYGLRYRFCVKFVSIYWRSKAVFTYQYLESRQITDNIKDRGGIKSIKNWLSLGYASRH